MHSLLTALVLLLILAASAPASPVKPLILWHDRGDSHSSPAKHPRPLVLWHGLGDSHSSPGMLQFQDAIKQIHPGIFIHSVFIEQDLDADRKAGFYGNVDLQVALVADQIAGIDELKHGFDAIGFSQGGQFLRAYVERYAHSIAPVRNLITFGSQHMGVSDIPTCGTYDIPCQLARRVAKRAVYSKWAQENLVQAQYFRDPFNLPAYLASNAFLTDINNEIHDDHNDTYSRNLAGLDALVLILFTQDRTVVPKESAWFGSHAVPEAEDTSYDSAFPPITDQTTFSGSSPSMQVSTTNLTVIPMRRHPIYTENWIGLRELDERDALFFLTCEGEHMHIGSCWEDIVPYFTGTLENDEC